MLQFGARRLESYAHAKKALFDYIAVFSNQRRRHSRLGQISPAEFDRRVKAAQEGTVGRSASPCMPPIGALLY